MRGVALLRRLLRVATDVRVLYAIPGIIFSVLAHEAFHILVHIGEIESIRLLPNWSTLVAIDVDAASSTSLMYEEFIAYSITIIILLVTAIDIFAIHDSRDSRTIHETIVHTQPIFAEFDDATIAKALNIND